MTAQDYIEMFPAEPPDGDSDSDFTDVQMTMIEWLTLVQMPNGVTLENWAKLRGLDVHGRPLTYYEES